MMCHTECFCAQGLVTTLWHHSLEVLGTSGGWTLLKEVGHGVYNISCPGPSLSLIFWPLDMNNHAFLCLPIMMLFLTTVHEQRG